MKIVLILPSYNAEKTLVQLVDKIPTAVFDEIILVDDCSTDRTYALAKKLKTLQSYQNPHNLGYGGNLKRCLSIALEHGADTIVELHPDGEYGTDGIKPALIEIKKGAQLVLGERKNFRHSGIYLWKYLFIRLLSWFDNLILKTDIPDPHQGFRVYTKELLSIIDYKSLSDGYIFSFEFITLTVFLSLTISSVPVTAHYSGPKRGANLRSSIVYGLKTFLVLLCKGRP